MLGCGVDVITAIVVKIIDWMHTDDPGAYWFGAMFAFLFDMFLLSLAVYQLRVWLGW
jgi:hypothetical protein